MTKISLALIVSAAVLLIGGQEALAAGLSKAQCDKLEQEYTVLQQKEKNHTLTAAERRRMHQIDDQTNIYCS